MKRTSMLGNNFVRGGLVRGAVALAALLLVSGCELLVDFDRSKIPEDSGFADFDVQAGDAGGDATMPQDAGPSNDATMGDAPFEAATSEGGSDAANEASVGPSEAAPGDGASPDSTSDGASPDSTSVTDASGTSEAEAASPASASDSSSADDGG
jgi:hypothetical protein